MKYTCLIVHNIFFKPAKDGLKPVQERVREKYDVKNKSNAWIQLDNIEKN